MSVDPLDGCTFWYTNEYYVTNSAATWHTRIGAFRYAGCSAPQTGTLSGVVTSASGGAPIPGATVTAGTLYRGHRCGWALCAGVTPSHLHRHRRKTRIFTINLYRGGGHHRSDGTHDFALAPRAAAVLSGYIRDGSGHGYPMYARLEISAPSYSAMVFTNPVTGVYQTSLFQGQTYTLRVSSQGLAGYTGQTTAVTPASANVALNFNLQVDPACTAPGYQLSGGVCSPKSGGLATGFVIDYNYPAVGLNGAYVSSGEGGIASSFATPLDPSVGDGMYVIFQPTVDNTNPEDHILAGRFMNIYQTVIHMDELPSQ